MLASGIRPLLLWAALHFYLMGRTMQRDLWTPEEEPATA